MENRLTLIVPRFERQRCGTYKSIRSRHVGKNITISCGCARHDIPIKKHGQNRRTAVSKAYKSWHCMKQRCTNENNPAYEYYGGRGIKVCERWLKFENFYTDKGERPEAKTLDRINVNGDYEPGNCRWATAKEQANNIRRVK